MTDRIHDLLIIGAGPGGYAAAFHAADLGLKVTLIDPAEHPGGVCLYEGCIPSKALLHVARVLTETREAADWGISFKSPEIDLDKLREWKNSVIRKLTSGLGQLTRQRKIDYIRGTAKFESSQVLSISIDSSPPAIIRFRNAIIATGSKPVIPEQFKTDPDRVMDSSGILELKDIPGNMLVIGGGYIGLELGTVFSALGAEVTVVEMLPNLLPGADRDLSALLTHSLKARFSNIMLNTTVEKLRVQKDGVRVDFKGANVENARKVYDRVLVSIGRKPHTAGLGIENTAVKLDQRGFIRVNGKRQTDEPSIWAVGDVAGEPMLAHKASHEGRIAVEAIAGKKSVFEPAAIPAVVFTDPEVAWCGLTETEASSKGIDVKVAKFPWGASGRATTLGRNDGMTKLLVDPKTERILGVGMVGVGAGEMIAEAVLAIEMSANATDLSLTIHPHPTLSETIMEAAEMCLGQATHLFRPVKR